MSGALPKANSKASPDVFFYTSNTALMQPSFSGLFVTCIPPRINHTRQHRVTLSARMRCRHGTTAKRMHVHAWITCRLDADPS
jgi:hypothetical protein